MWKGCARDNSLVLITEFLLVGFHLKSFSMCPVCILNKKPRKNGLCQLLGYNFSFPVSGLHRILGSLFPIMTWTWQYNVEQGNKKDPKGEIKRIASFQIAVPILLVLYAYLINS